MVYPRQETFGNRWNNTLGEKKQDAEFMYQRSDLQSFSCNRQGKPLKAPPTGMTAHCKLIIPDPQLIIR